MRRNFSNAQLADLKDGIDCTAPHEPHQSHLGSADHHEEHRGTTYNPVPQAAPGAHAAVGHTIENSIPLSIFPVAADKFCIVFCGLPGRGKTHISRRLAKYLSFFHAMEVEMFNVTEYRRKYYGEAESFQNANWFDNDNIAALQMRTKFNQLAIDDMVKFLNEHTNGVAIFDATNSTRERRAHLVNSVRPTGAKILFIEVSNDNEQFLAQNYRIAALSSPEYKGMDPDVAVSICFFFVIIV